MPQKTATVDSKLSNNITNKVDAKKAKTTLDEAYITVEAKYLEDNNNNRIYRAPDQSRLLSGALHTCTHNLLKYDKFFNVYKL